MFGEFLLRVAKSNWFSQRIGIEVKSDRRGSGRIGLPDSLILPTEYNK